LIGAAMPIVRSAFGIPRRDDHFGGLAAAVAEGHAKTLSESKNLALHEPLARTCRARGRACGVMMGGMRR
jgi:hypothetical protein